MLDISRSFSASPTLPPHASSLLTTVSVFPRDYPSLMLAAATFCFTQTPQ